MIRTADLEWLEKQGRQLEDYLLFYINYGISFKKNARVQTDPSYLRRSLQVSINFNEQVLHWYVHVYP